MPSLFRTARFASANLLLGVGSFDGEAAAQRFGARRRLEQAPPPRVQAGSRASDRSPRPVDLEGCLKKRFGSQGRLAALQLSLTHARKVSFFGDGIG